MTTTTDTYLDGIRVLELADEHGEYVGKVLAALGADVVKVEPPRGERTREYGPFYEDVPGPDRSLYFWHYNMGKRGICLDLRAPSGQTDLEALAASADVIIDARQPGDDVPGFNFDRLRAANPGLIHLRITPFGEKGPWAGYAGSDLVHLALGGIAMNSGYDPDPNGFYDTPPIAPQMWQAYHIAGEIGVMSVLAALNHRLSTGRGQRLSLSVHHAVAVTTESDIPRWVALRTPSIRQTGRHAMPALSMRAQSQTKDGRYILPYATYIKNFPSSWDADVAILRKYGMQEDLDDPRWEDPEYRADHRQHLADVMDRLVKRTTFDSGLWREMLDAGVPWAPIRSPEENLGDEHWAKRGTFVEVPYPELGRTFTDVGPRWLSGEANWAAPRRAPHLGEHTAEVLSAWAKTPITVAAPRRGSRVGAISASRPTVLDGVRVVDLSWMLASAGAGRILAAMGAEVIKVEHLSRLDGMRSSGISYPEGGRAERDSADSPITAPPQESVNQSASFNEINTGKLGISLNLKTDRAKEILADLIRDADVVVEGFSPGTMQRLGFGFDRLKELNPSIIYVQQSGLGQYGLYGGAKAFGPTAQAFSGITDMSGLPNPWPPAGIGFSYLDWFGAYNVATATLAALHRRNVTGEGCHIDASQVEVGLYLTGTAILDNSANGRTWQRYGNRSPYKIAAPSGIYRCEGTDRWIAISIFTDRQWAAAMSVLGNPDWASDPRFATSQARFANQDALDELIDQETARWERYNLMSALQSAGVPAGVAQNTQDRFESDDQLAALDWMTELNQTETGTWPVRTFPAEFEETPIRMGGPKDRGAPNYGEDTEDVLTRILDLSADEIEELRRDGII
ncbi:CoA transferase [Rhodococcus sp. DMU1]|uniref:CaiB/BaiF CoA transferase family protein n=1 Tax=Rhodococcus sp. DMU1 TaxID=2722825 RepID=UPI00143EC9C1|nr:CoA transferase [Rhodococcus sp. DMU1]QIX53848.1 CoA transferase [Rhodococcus sp. DMU1]